MGRSAVSQPEQTVVDRSSPGQLGMDYTTGHSNTQATITLEGGRAIGQVSMSGRSESGARVSESCRNGLGSSWSYGGQRMPSCR